MNPSPYSVHCTGQAGHDRGLEDYSCDSLWSSTILYMNNLSYDLTSSSMYMCAVKGMYSTYDLTSSSMYMCTVKGIKLYDLTSSIMYMCTVKGMYSMILPHQVYVHVYSEGNVHYMILPHQVCTVHVDSEGNVLYDLIPHQECTCGL